MAAFGPGIITTVAREAAPAITHVALDAVGNVYYTDGGPISGTQVVRKMTPGGVVTTVAGSGSYTCTHDTDGYGNSCPATSVTFQWLNGLALDGAGNLYISNTGANIIQKVTPGGTIFTFAGGGRIPNSPNNYGYYGDGGPATSAQLWYPWGLGVDGADNLYIADDLNRIIRKVTPGGIITTVAGYYNPNDAPGFGDGGRATSAPLGGPTGVTVDGLGNLYITDSNWSTIRKVTPGGIITTVAGNYTWGYSGDGGPATSAQTNTPVGSVAVDAAGNFYFAEYSNHVIRKVTAGGIITTVAGKYDASMGSYSGDGGPATSAELLYPYDVALDETGNLYIVTSIDDATHPHTRVGSVVRKVDVSAPALSFAGTNYQGVSAAQDVTVLNLGNAPLNISQINPTANFTLQGTNTSCSTVGQILASGDSCILGIEFAPQIAGPVSGGVVLTDNSLNASSVQQTIALQGIALKPALTVTAANASRTYGVENPPFTGAIVGLQNGDNITATYSSVADVNSPVGTYSIVPVLVDPENKLGNYSVTYNAAELTITKGTQGVVTVTGPSLAHYGQLGLWPLATGGNGTGAYTLSAGASTACSIDPSYGALTITSGTGTCSITAIRAGDANYNVSAASNPFVVPIIRAAASVTPTAATKAYGTADPGFTGTLSGFVIGDNVTATYSRVAGEAVAGSPYAISAVLSPAGVLGNYDVTYNTAELTITKGTQDVVTVGGLPSSANYRQPGLSAVATGGSDPHVYTFSAGASTACSIDPSSGSLTITSGTGTCSITATNVGNANYNVSAPSSPFVIAITRATASVTPTAATKVYGTADPGFTGTLSGFVAGDSVTATYGRVAGEAVAGGPYVISAVLSPAGTLANYTVTYNSGALTITKAPLTVTAANASRAYGAANPTLTGTIVRLVNGDSITATYSSAANASSPAGLYPIVPSLIDPTGKLANYTATIVNGTLTVWGAPSTVSVTPSSGVGSSQVFKLTYTDPTGYAAITWAQTIFSAVQTYGTSCAFLYTPSTGSIQMKDDGGLNWSSPATLGAPGVLQNSQCSIDVGASAAVGAGNNLTLSYAVTFKPAYVGIKNTYMYATNKYGLNSGWSLLGTWTLPGIPSAVSVTPSSGTGTVQLFQLKYSDPTGFAAITWAQTIFSAAQTYGNSCAFLYTASTGSIQMKDDSGLNWSAAAKLGVPGMLQNTQCSIDVGASSAVGAGNNLTLSYAVTFKPAYVGAKNVYMNAVNKYGLNSGWSSHGTWNVPGNPPTIVSILPSTGSGASQQFQLTYSDPGGFAAITMAQTIFSSARTYGNSCAFLYTASTGSIQMKDDSGANWGTAAKLGVGGVLQNSQCSIDAGASSAVGTGNNLTLSYAVSFKPAYAGAKSVYSLANDKFGLDSTWQTPGTWTVPAGAPSILSIAPSSGTGTTQLFQLTYSDPAGFAAITLTQAIFGAAQSYGHSCAILYTASNGSIQIKDDSGLNWSSSVKLGVAGVLANSQCSIDAGSSSGVGAGNNLTVKLAVTFKSTYTGAKNIYSLANNKFARDSGWQILGTWAVPGPLAITTTSLANATIGTAYSKTLSTTGGTAPISWSVTTGTLPSWLTLHSTTGVLDGTPTGAPTTTNFTVKATDAGSPSQTKTQALSITTISALPIGVTVIPSTATVGINTPFPFSWSVTNTSNTAVTWSIQEGATGGTVNAFGSYMSPGHSGTYHVVATSVADPTKSGLATVTVTAPVPVFTSIPPTGAVEGNLYSYAVSATGTAVTFTLTTAPGGATINAGIVSWTPTQAQSRTMNSFVVTAMAASGGVATQQWSVSPAGTIRGTNIITYVADSGPVDLPADVSTYTIAAYVPNGASLTKLAGTGLANGTFTIPNVPAGYFWLEFRGTGIAPTWIWTSTSTIDVGYDQQGRPGVLYGDGGDLNINVSTSTIWQSSDLLEVYSSNANTEIWSSPLPGALGTNSLVDALGTNWLVDPTRGDRVYVGQLATRSVSGIPAQVLTNALGPLATTIGMGPSSISGQLQPLALTNSFRANIKGSTVAATLQSVNPGAIAIGTFFGLDLQPGGSSRGFIASAAPDLVMIDSQNAISTDTDLGNVSYGNPYPSGWTPFVLLRNSSCVPYLAQGATTSIQWCLSAQAYSTTMPTSTSGFGLLVGFPTSPTIDGSSFFNDRSGAVSSPTLSWQPPLVGSATSYFLTIHRLYRGGSGTTQFSAVATLCTKQTSLVVPPDLLIPGSSYVFTLSANFSPTKDIEQNPFRHEFPTGNAETSSGVYTTTGTVGSIKVLSPNGGEMWTAGSTQAIQWSSTNPTGDVTLTLRKGSIAYRTITTVPASSAGTYFWTVPTDVPFSNDYKIGIASASDPLVVDFSDAYFSISAATSPLTINTVSLPNGTVNAPYTAMLASTGGTTPVTWSVSSGVLPQGLTLNSASGVISGTPTGTATTTNFTVKATDAGLPAQTKTQALSITTVIALPISVTVIPSTASVGINTPYPFSVTVANTSNTAVTWSIQEGATGGTINAFGSYMSPGHLGVYHVIATSIADPTKTGMATVTVTAPSPIFTSFPPLTASEGSLYTYPVFVTDPAGTAVTLSLTGAPAGATINAGIVNWTPSQAQAGKANLFTVTATAATGGVATQQWSVIPSIIQSGFNVNGNIILNNSGAGVQGVTVTINTNPIRTTVTNNFGNFNFSGVPNGSYTITPSITGPSSMFYPATQNISVNGGEIQGISIMAALGYTVSGNVTYSGTQRGRIYLTLLGPGGSFPLGTSIAGPGPFSIRGVPPGPYSLQAWMDNLDFGVQNASNATGSSGLSISTVNVTGASVTLSDPASPVDLTSLSTKIQTVGAFDKGVIMSVNAIKNSDSLELPTNYNFQWSTAADFSAHSGTTLPANGSKDPVILHGLTGLTNGTALYFRVRGENGTNSLWSPTFGPVTIGALTGSNSVSGTVTFAGSATGPLYVGFFDENTNKIYTVAIDHPVSPQSYTVAGVPNGNNYFAFGIVDQNNNGIIDAGDISNTDQDGGASVMISSTTVGQNLALPSGNSSASLTTQHFSFTGQSGDSYNLSFDIRAMHKRPVAVALVSGPNLLSPVDIPIGQGRGGRFQYVPNLNSNRPNVGDTYGLQFTYSDGTFETLNPSVSGVLDAFAQNLLPTGSGSGNTTPTFSWTDPANPTNYIYRFQLNDTTFNTVWQIPSQSNGFSSATTFLSWGIDPTGGNDLPNVPSLTVGAPYSWNITVIDSNGNT